MDDAYCMGNQQGHISSRAWAKVKKSDFRRTHWIATCPDLNRIPFKRLCVGNNGRKILGWVHERNAELWCAACCERKSWEPREDRKVGVFNERAGASPG